MCRELIMCVFIVRDISLFHSYIQFKKHFYRDMLFIQTEIKDIWFKARVNAKCEVFQFSAHISPVTQTYLAGNPLLQSRRSVGCKPVTILWLFQRKLL